MDGAKARVCVAQFVEQARKGVAKLHGFEGGKRHRVLVDAPEGVVDNDAGASVPLGDNAHG